MLFDEVRHSEYDCLSEASFIFASTRVVNSMHPNDSSGAWDCEGDFNKIHITNHSIMTHLPSFPPYLRT